MNDRESLVYVLLLTPVYRRRLVKNIVYETNKFDISIFPTFQGACSLANSLTWNKKISRLNTPYLELFIGKDQKRKEDGNSEQRNDIFVYMGGYWGKKLTLKCWQDNVKSTDHIELTLHNWKITSFFYLFNANLE